MWSSLGSRVGFHNGAGTRLYKAIQERMERQIVETSCCLVVKSCPTLETPCTCQAPLSMGFPRQEYSSGLLFLFLGDLPDLGIVLSIGKRIYSFPLSYQESRHIIQNLNFTLLDVRFLPAQPCIYQCSQDIIPYLPKICHEAFL